MMVDVYYGWTNAREALLYRDTTADERFRRTRVSARLLADPDCCGRAADPGRLIVPHCWKTGLRIPASAHLCAATAFRGTAATGTDKDELQLVEARLPEVFGRSLARQPAVPS